MFHWDENLKVFELIESEGNDACRSSSTKTGENSENASEKLGNDDASVSCNDEGEEISCKKRSHSKNKIASQTFAQSLNTFQSEHSQENKSNRIVNSLTNFKHKKQNFAQQMPEKKVLFKPKILLKNGKPIKDENNCRKFKESGFIRIF